MNIPKHLPLIDALIFQQETKAGLSLLESIRRKENKVGIFLDTGAEADLISNEFIDELCSLGFFVR